MRRPGHLTAIIVDDDAFSCFHLSDIIQHKMDNVELLATYNSAEDSLENIQKLQPDIVFLDVEMPGGMNGFDMLKKLPAINFDIIFTTAHDYYAIRAIRFSAVDYLLKPIEATALQEAVSRVVEKRSNANPSLWQMEVVSQTRAKLDNLAIPTMEGLLFIGLQDIVYCEGDDKYTKIYMTDKKMIVSSRTLGVFEDLLSAYNFFRIHKSYLINLNHLKKYLRGEGGQVIMANGSTLDVARRKKEDLLKLVS
jgi:two-component system LytT family response regulator